MEQSGPSGQAKWGRNAEIQEHGTVPASHTGLARSGMRRRDTPVGQVATAPGHTAAGKPPRGTQPIRPAPAGPCQGVVGGV